uniref:Putative secreted protein n=1 Tax=Ixodes scapularis TaxID=6945 RepID=Q4PN20_IXOSC|nr:putative secreted protein [Ixodes scapularis]
MIKLMFLAIFAAVLTLHVFVEGGLLKPEHAYDCYWAIANASDRVCRNHKQDGFSFFNLYTCSARCTSGNIERRLPPGITCQENGFGHPPPGTLECVGDIGQNNEPLVCFGCTSEVTDTLSKWQSSEPFWQQFGL